MHRHARKSDIHGVGAYVFAELEEFVIAETIRGPIFPVTPHARAFFGRTNHGPPVGSRLPGESLHIAAARVANK